MFIVTLCFIKNKYFQARNGLFFNHVFISVTISAHEKNMAQRLLVMFLLF